MSDTPNPQDYYVSLYSGEEWDAFFGSAKNELRLVKLYSSVAEMNADYSGSDVLTGQFVGIATASADDADYGKIYVKGPSAFVYWTTISSLDGIQGPQGVQGPQGPKGDTGATGPQGPKGDTGATGPQGEKGDIGSGLTILDYYESLAALQAAVPSPAPGDSYGIGTAEPFDIYTYGETSGWVNNGPIQGPQGPKGDTGPQGPQGEKGEKGDKGEPAKVNGVEPDESGEITLDAGDIPGAVRYDASQSLTATQQATARTNINAVAPLKSMKMIGDAEGDPNLSAVGWYRIFSFDNTNGSALVHIQNQWSNAPPTDLLLYAVSDPYKPLVAILASSRNKNGASVDDARLMKSADGSKIYFDIHYFRTGNNSVGCDVVVSSGLSFKAPSVTWQSYAAVDDEPEGETLLALAEWADPPMELGTEYRTTERYQGKPVYRKLIDIGTLPASTVKKIAHNVENALPVKIYGKTSNSNTIPFINSTSRVDIAADNAEILISSTYDASGMTGTAEMHYIKSTD